MLLADGILSIMCRVRFCELIHWTLACWVCVVQPAVMLYMSCPTRSWYGDANNLFNSSLILFCIVFSFVLYIDPYLYRLCINNYLSPSLWFNCVNINVFVVKILHLDSIVFIIGPHHEAGGRSGRCAFAEVEWRWGGVTTLRVKSATVSTGRKGFELWAMVCK